MVADRPEPSFSRPATLGEQAIFRMATHRKRALHSMRDSRLLDHAIQRLAETPEAALEEVASPLLPQRFEHEWQLLRRIDQFQGSRRAAAARLLGMIGSRRCVPMLIELYRQDETRKEALAGLARLAAPEELSELVLAETAPERQRELLAALAGRRDLRAMRIYFQWVANAKTSEIALAALAEVSAPPVDLLLALLDSQRQADRVASAIVLGRLRDPRISDLLIRRAMKDAGGQESLLALVARSDPSASRFVALAWNDPVLAGPIRAASHRLDAALRQSLPRELSPRSNL
jgi:hypothetical protein